MAIVTDYFAARAAQVRHRVYCWTCLEPPRRDANEATDRKMLHFPGDPRP